MLAVTRYPREYVDACRSRVRTQLAAYRRVASSADEAAVASFAPLFFANLTLALDASFVHRTRAIEGKDGNPLNEVRMLCTSILTNDGVLLADRTIKYEAKASVLKLEIGDQIRLDEKQFKKLSDAFFAQIGRKFT